MAGQLKKVFEKVAELNTWANPDSLSGRGSNLEQTIVIRKEIPELVKKYAIKTMLDAPCGDLFWMREILPSLINIEVKYTGADIVTSLINSNIEKLSQPAVDFKCVDLTRSDTGQYDLIFTRDCFIHLSFKNIYLILSNYKKSGSRYLLTNTYLQEERSNIDVDDHFVQGRMLNMQKFPFYFPTPIEMINEGCTEGDGQEYNDKSLGLWELKSINLSVLKFWITMSSILKPFSFNKQQHK